MSKKQKVEETKGEKQQQHQNADNDINTNKKNDGEQKQPASSQKKTEEKQKEDKKVEDDVISEKEQQLMEKMAEMQDKYLRLSAEYDNYRKRTLKEKMDLQKYGSEKVLLDILPLMDDVERAVTAMGGTDDINAVREGVKLIHDKFIDFLKHSGIKEIEAMHCDFDVDIHDAVAKLPAEDEKMKGKIIDVVQKGYYLHDKVIRHSKVVIGE